MASRDNILLCTLWCLCITLVAISGQAIARYWHAAVENTQCADCPEPSYVQKTEDLINHMRRKTDSSYTLVHDPTESKWAYGDDVVIKTGFYKGRVGFVADRDAKGSYTVRLVDRFTIYVEGRFISVDAPTLTGVTDADLEPMPAKAVKHE